MGLIDRYNKAQSSNTGLASENPEIAPPKQGNPEAQFKGSNLDLEFEAPNGGPNHAPLNGHTQVYTPKNTYLDSPEGQLRSNDSPAGQGGKGGPTNVPYTTKIGSETKTFNTTNPYIPEKTYTNLFQLRGDIDVSRLRDSYK